MSQILTYFNGCHTSAEIECQGITNKERSSVKMLIREAKREDAEQIMAVIKMQKSLI